MRYLGIDYGTKKVGVAKSNDAGTMAFPVTVLPNDAELLNAIELMLEEYNTEMIVIGSSIDLHGNPNKLQALIDEFVGDLTLRVPIPIVVQDERLTTQAAIQIQGRNEMTDASAAALILDSYLQKQN